MKKPNKANKRSAPMSETSVLRITGVPLSMRQEIENVSENSEENISVLVRPVLRKWLESLPERMKTKPKQF